MIVLKFKHKQGKILRIYMDAVRFMYVFVLQTLDRGIIVIK